MQTITEEVRALYEAYLTQVRRLERARKPWEGILGFGGGPQDHPCHEQFAAGLERLLQAAAAQPLPPEQAHALLSGIYFPDRSGRQDSADWMLLAVHSLTLALIPLLSPPDARELCGQYQRTYPCRTLLPAQERVLQALKARGELSQ